MSRSEEKPASRRLKPEERRRQAIEATLACLARDGAPGTGIRQVAREMGVAPSLVNYLFGSRSQLFLAAYETLAAERPLLDNAPLRELSDFHLYLAAQWLAERQGRKQDPLVPLKRSYDELMRQTGFLAPAMRQRFLFQVPLHRGIVDADTRHGLSLPAR